MGANASLILDDPVLDFKPARKKYTIVGMKWD
jgi:hypothetical protein